MARKDLAGLAALAGMAYLANRDKGGADAGNTGPAAQAAPQAAPQIEDESDRGSMTPDQLAYDKQPTAPAARPRPVAKPVARPMGGSGRGGQGGATADELAAYAANKKPAYESSYDRSRREDREAGRDIGSVVEGLKNRIATAGERGSALPLKSTKADKNDFMGSTGLKKGGKVKKMASGGTASKVSGVKGWGIARGSRKAKNY
jgi:hypothetical protein